MLKLNVGFSKKVGEPNYGSRGANVNLELELESSLIGDVDRVRARIRYLFRLARRAVQEELATQAGNRISRPSDDASPAGRLNGIHRDGTRFATNNQLQAINTLADRRKIYLAALLDKRFQVHDPAALTISEASELIDELKKHATDGNGGLSDEGIHETAG